MTGLYYVLYENPYFDRGTWLEEQIDPTEYDPDFEVDVPEQMVRAVHMIGVNRLQLGANYGLEIPLRLVREYCMKYQTRGIDKRW